MAQVRHQRAKTMHAIREDIQRSSASVAELSRRTASTRKQSANGGAVRLSRMSAWAPKSQHPRRYQASRRQLLLPFGEPLCFLLMTASLRYSALCLT